jgi:hypothetical protein
MRCYRLPIASPHASERRPASLPLTPHESLLAEPPVPMERPRKGPLAERAKSRYSEKETFADEAIEIVGRSRCETM